MYLIPTSPKKLKLTNPKERILGLDLVLYVWEERPGIKAMSTLFWRSINRIVAGSAYFHFYDLSFVIDMYQICTPYRLVPVLRLAPVRAPAVLALPNTVSARQKTPHYR
jgi:hypothetical protein